MKDVSINDDQRPGRLKTSTDERSVKHVANFLAQDRQATCGEISQATRTSLTSVFRILTICREEKFVPDGSLTA